MSMNMLTVVVGFVLAVLMLGGFGFQTLQIRGLRAMVARELVAIERLQASALAAIERTEVASIYAAGVAEERARIDALFAFELEDWDDGDHTWTALTRLRDWVTRSVVIDPHR